MYCSNRDSPNIRKLSLVYESGVTRVNTTTFGIAGGGVGGASTSGTHVSAIAQRATPPRKRETKAWLVFALICVALTFVNHWWVVGALLLGAVFLQSVTYNQQNWPKLFAAWDAAYLCERCGTIAPPRKLEASVINVTPLDGPDHRAIGSES